jgi:hypothetical protein
MEIDKHPRGKNEEKISIDLEKLASDWILYDDNRASANNKPIRLVKPE